MIYEDVIVYAHPDGKTYVGNFGEGGWLIWPAVKDGWKSRQGCPASVADSCEELDPKLAQLSLRLSGVTL